MYDSADLPDPSVFGLREPRRPRLCSLDDCGEKHHAEGYCRKHWERWKATGDPHKVRPAGRRRVGSPTRTVPATADRGPREATVQVMVALGVEQWEQVKARAVRLVTSGNQVIRADVARLINGDIPLPTKAEDIPDAAPGMSAWRSWIPGPEQVEDLARVADEVRPLLDQIRAAQEGRPGPRSNPERWDMSALVRYAVARHVDTTTED